MKTIKLTLPLLFLLLLTVAAQATVLLEDSSNYPYADGLIEGQGQWYCYSPSTPKLNTFVTNNVILLVNSTTNDSVATPTNGYVNPTEFNFASFQINVTQLPTTAEGGYFFQFQGTNGSVGNACHVFIQTTDTSVPGTYRLAVANYQNSYTYTPPPTTFSQDLATNTWYTIVVLYDNNQGDLTFVGSTLWINPSEQDFQNLVDASGGYPSGIPGVGFGYVSGTDYSTSSNNLSFVSAQVGFATYVTAGISNVIVGTTFEDVNRTNLPVFGVEPQSGTNYSGNPLALYAVASGVDLNYQWYSTGHGKLSDGATYAGTTNNVFTVNSLSSSDNYYCIVTDAYGNTATTTNAVETVITTPTAPFFPAGTVPITNYANVFTIGGFTNIAYGTGPLNYQWYFAPTNAPTAFTPLAGQTNAIVANNMVDYTYQGNYYVAVTNSLGGIIGPTNTLVEVAPTVATITQLHNLMISFTNLINLNKSGATVISSNITVSGYVTTYGGFGSTYTEYFIQDGSGYGVEVFLQTASSPSFQNTNTPPVGTYVTATGLLEVYSGALELAPTVVLGNPLPVVTNTAAPAIPIGPTLANNIFNDLVQNPLGTNAMLYDCSLLTFTNVYFYYNKTGGFNGIANTNNLGVFKPNQATFNYFTVGGPYHYPDNTNVMEVYQFAYSYPEGTFGVVSPTSQTNAFYNLTIPIYCSQITGAWVDYAIAAGGELEPSRPADYVTNTPPAFSTTISQAKTVSTLGWQPSVGSTYSIYSSTNLLGPWTLEAQGVAYWPTNGAFSETNHASAKFYQVTTP